MQQQKKIIGEDCFVEVFVDTSLELCMERDAKGLYKKALDGELLDFTGISSPYEIPQKPQLTLTTNNDSPLDSTRIIYNWLLINKYIVK